jgi:hypothetical protein
VAGEEGVQPDALLRRDDNEGALYPFIGQVSASV